MKSYEKFALIKTAVAAAARVPDLREDFIKALRSEAAEAKTNMEPSPLEVAFTEAANDIEAMDKNPVDILEPFLRDLAARSGLDLDERAFQEMRAYCDQKVISISSRPKR